MADGKKRRNSKSEPVDALNDIRSRYSRISLSDIEKFAPVYYPVAIVEMQMEERTFEDFETVHLTILRLMAVGISDHRIIAQTLGLSPNYVLRIQRVLAGYGHISGSELTELGRESLAAEQKILTTQTMQKFQVDALNGILLKVRETVNLSTLDDKQHTDQRIGHLDYLDGITAESLIDQLSSGNCENYLQQKSGILHTNVTAINDIRCTEIQYAKCYLMKLTGHYYPIVFIKRYNRGAKNQKDQNFWQPCSVYDPSVITLCGFEQDVPINTDLANDYLLKMYGMLLQASRNVQLENEIPLAMARIYPFQKAGFRILSAVPDSESGVLVREDAFRHYHKNLIPMLCDLHRHGKYLITSKYLYGHIIAIQTASPGLRDLAATLTQKIELHGEHKVLRKLNDHFRDWEPNTSIVEEMIKQLLQI